MSCDGASILCQHNARAAAAAIQTIDTCRRLRYHAARPGEQAGRDMRLSAARGRISHDLGEIALVIR